MTANIKMTNSEKENLDEGEEDSEKNDRPLSREGWIMFLTDKINERYKTNGVFATICFACALAGLSGMVAFIIAKMDVKYLHVLLIFIIASIAIALIVRHLETKREKPIKWIREMIIHEEEGFTTYDEIRDQCEKAEVILTKNKNLLDETDMDNTNKKQKEVLQVSQSDIRDIKESLRRIEDINEVSLYSSNLHTFGSLLIAIGFTVLSIGLAVFSIRVSLVGDGNPSGIEETTIIGSLLILAGAFMFFGTSIAGNNVNLYKKLWKYIGLLLGFVFACLACCLAIIYMCIG